MWHRHCRLRPLRAMDGRFGIGFGCSNRRRREPLIWEAQAGAWVRNFCAEGITPARFGGGFSHQGLLVASAAAIFHEAATIRAPVHGDHVFGCEFHLGNPLDAVEQSRGFGKPEVCPFGSRLGGSPVMISAVFASRVRNIFIASSYFCASSR